MDSYMQVFTVLLKISISAGCASHQPGYESDSFLAGNWIRYIYYTTKYYNSNVK